MSQLSDPNVYSRDQQRVYITMTKQISPKGLPPRIKVMPTELGRRRLNAFWPCWLRRILLMAEYRPPLAVELHGQYVLVSSDKDFDRLWGRVRAQAERIRPLEPALQWQESGGRHQIEWRVPTADAYKAIRSNLVGQLKRLPRSVRIEFDAPYGSPRYQALLRAVNTKPGTKLPMAEIRREVELEAALLLRAGA